MAGPLLYDAHGRRVDFAKVQGSRHYAKKAEPIKGEAFGIWGEDALHRYANLPGYGIVQFDLSRLQLSDYKAMRDHYQVNASLSVLSFMQHQSDWHIECENKKIAAECEDQLRAVWTQLNRSLSMANWAGFAPAVLQWDNDPIRAKTVLTKIKDLEPESVEVNWKQVDGWTPPGSNAINKIKIYDGIKQIGVPWAIPAENTFWYPLLMEQGNFGGRKLLRPAFTSWFFSILIHMFANRYFERYGEPIIKGRAPFTDDVKMPDGQVVNGLEYLLEVMRDLRNRSVIALPDDKTEMSNGRMEFDYDISYLEGQMRGADWERYLTRLDEEISIGLFTPILLLRTADVGSYNLGVGHMQMYLWMLNAMNDDRAQYIDKYILSRIVDMNFSSKAPRPKIKFRKLGNQNAEVIKTLIQILATKDKIKIDPRELGQIAGLTIEEVDIMTRKKEQEIMNPVPAPAGNDPNGEDAEVVSIKESGKKPSIKREVAARAYAQVRNSFEKGFQKSLFPDFGFQKALVDAFVNEDGMNRDAAVVLVEHIYDVLKEWTTVVLQNVSSADEYEKMLTDLLNDLIPG